VQRFSDCLMGNLPGIGRWSTGMVCRSRRLRNR